VAKSGKKSETKVTRITANDSPRHQKTKKTSAKIADVTPSRPVKVDETKGTSRRPNALKGFVGYFKGAWYELRQVRWPDRRTTWGMTGALLAFTAFFIVVILLLDAAFAELFNVLLGK